MPNTPHMKGRQTKHTSAARAGGERRSEEGHASLRVGGRAETQQNAAQGGGILLSRASLVGRWEKEGGR